MACTDKDVPLFKSCVDVIGPTPGMDPVLGLAADYAFIPMVRDPVELENFYWKF